MEVSNRKAKKLLAKLQPQQERQPDWKPEDINRICFRGDSRPPYNEYLENNDKFKADNKIAIFQYGFRCVEAPTYREKEDTAGDVEKGGICVTTRFKVATLFPLNATPVAWVYSVYVREGYNTHKHQANDSLALLKKKRACSFREKLVRRMTFGRVDRRAPIEDTTAMTVMWSLYGDELVTMKIPPCDVIACVKVIRIDWREHLGQFKVGEDTWKCGINYRLVGPVVQNPDCALDDSTKELAVGFLENELAFYSMGKTAVLTEGFTRSDKK